MEIEVIKESSGVENDIKVEELIKVEKVLENPSNENSPMEIEDNKPVIKVKEEITIDGILLQNSKALNLLAQYSDSEGSESSDSDDEQNPTNQKYRDAKSSSSSESSDEEITVQQIKKKLEAPLSDHEDSDEGNGENAGRRKKREPLKVKGEMGLEDLPPIQDLQIQVEEEDCLELGTISSIVDQLVLVEAYPHSAPLDIDSILFIDRGKKALGKIFDVIGPVANPIYCIRFNSNEDIKSKGLSIGDKVFCAPRTEYTSYVILSSIMNKGSDASWKNDVEPPASMIDYSDDEQERRAKRPPKNQGEQSNSNRQPRVRQHNNYQQYPQYPMSWHQQSQSNYNYAVYDQYFQQ